MAQVIYRCFAVTHVGHLREHNEDTIAVSGADAEPLAQWSGEVSSETAWALLADGMGGHAAGEVASQIVVELLKQVVLEIVSARDVVLAVKGVNDALYDVMDRHPELMGMGTTIAGVVVRGASALVFNVGDSRVYLQSEGDLTKLSRDHVVGGNMLTQCLGGVSRPKLIDPHVEEVTLTAGSKLMLCSDGLTDLVSDMEIGRILDGGRDNPAQELIEAALAAGGHDNVSVILINYVSEQCPSVSVPSAST